MSRQHANRLLRHGSVLKLVDGSDLSDTKTKPIGLEIKERHTREVADMPAEEAAEVITQGTAGATFVSQIKED